MLSLSVFSKQFAKSVDASFDPDVSSLVMTEGRHRRQLFLNF